MKRSLIKVIVIVLTVCGLLFAGMVSLDIYLFRKRLAHTNIKEFYPILMAIVKDLGRADVISPSPELAAGDYELALVTTNAVLFHTHSFTCSAYLMCYRQKTSNAWTIGWLKGGKFSQLGTFRF